MVEVVVLSGGFRPLRDGMGTDVSLGRSSVVGLPSESASAGVWSSSTTSIFSAATSSKKRPHPPNRTATIRIAGAAILRRLVGLVGID